ncbi:glycosyltransferase family 2 protein [Pseudohaliea sp.]|uniref:glycosyltransferase family 2 protein n=1 Tax=Pseudohaliea sp. TaxID=2740289 RepID=UPI0032EC981C
MKISVITAVYNRADTVGHAISSVQSQTHGDIEHLIQDGGSTDGTLEEISRLANSATMLYSESDNGLYEAVNRGILRSTGDIIGLMHSDDFYANDYVLEKIANAMANPSVQGVYGDLQYVSTSDPDRVIRNWKAGTYALHRLRRGWMPPHPTLYLRREVFEKWGLYDTEYRIAADYDAVLRYLAHGRISLAYVQEVLVKMRVGGESNRSAGRIIEKSREDYRALRSNGVGGLRALAMKNLSKLGQFL